MSEENILTDRNSPGWRYLRDTEQIQPGDEFLNSGCMWCLTNRVGEIAGRQVTYRRCIEPVPSDSDNVAELNVKQPAPPLPGRQPENRPTSPPPPRKRADTDSPEWRIEALQNMLYILTERRNSK